LAKGYSLSIFTQLKAAREQLSQAQAHLEKCQVKGESEAQIESAQAQVVEGEARVAHWQEVRDTYRGHLEAMSLQVHPWRLEDSTPQSAQEVEAQLEAEVTALQVLIEANGLPLKQKVLDKARKQLADLAAVIDVWWQGVRQDAHHQIVLTPEWVHWMEAYLLPLMYWERLVSRTRGRRRKAKMVAALQAAQAAFEAYPLTAKLAPEVLAGWKAWAAEHAKTFQREVGPPTQPPRRWKVAMATYLRCITIIGVCLNGATGCGARSTTSIVRPQMAPRQPHGFSGRSFPAFLRRCYPKSTNCLCLVSAKRLWR